MMWILRLIHFAWSNLHPPLHFKRFDMPTENSSYDPPPSNTWLIELYSTSLILWINGIITKNFVCGAPPLLPWSIATYWIGSLYNNTSIVEIFKFFKIPVKSIFEKRLPITVILQKSLHQFMGMQLPCQPWLKKFHWMKFRSHRALQHNCRSHKQCMHTGSCIPTCIQVVPTWPMPLPSPRIGMLAALVQ